MDDAARRRRLNLRAPLPPSPIEAMVLRLYRAGQLPQLERVAVTDERICATCCRVIRVRVLRERPRPATWPNGGVYVDRRCEYAE